MRLKSVSFAPIAAAQPIHGVLVALPPNPPPVRLHFAVTCAWLIPRQYATARCTLSNPCDPILTITWSSSISTEAWWGSIKWWYWPGMRRLPEISLRPFCPNTFSTSPDIFLSIPANPSALGKKSFVFIAS